MTERVRWRAELGASPYYAAVTGAQPNFLWAAVDSLHPMIDVKAIARRTRLVAQVRAASAQIVYDPAVDQAFVR